MTSTLTPENHLPELDLDFVRAQFPAFELPGHQGNSFFENAGGSYICRQTIELLAGLYAGKVQPYADYGPSAELGKAMDQAHSRWAQALGVTADEIHFGPSTSANTYVLANALEHLIGENDEIVVTNQDHEANTGAIRRMAKRAGARLREWEIDPETGLLDLETLQAVLSERTKIVTFPHCSNIIGLENDVKAVTKMAHAVGARVIVDGVSFAPHSIPDVSDLGCDVYLFSLYKVYSVHQGLMVVQNGLIDDVQNQGHFFNADLASKRLTPAGPDHVQIAASTGVLDYVAALAEHHGVSGAQDVSALWSRHETKLLEPLLIALNELDVRLIGPPSVDTTQAAPLHEASGLHRCPTVAFVPQGDPDDVATKLIERGVMTAAGNFYAYRVLKGLGIDPEHGVVRLSFVHYTSEQDVDRAIKSLHDVLG
jgi:selenocysteine lyase/cysteine desulfurase